MQGRHSPNESVSSEYLRRFVDRQSVNFVSISSGRAGSKHGVIDRLFGGFDRSEKQWRHRVVADYLDVAVINLSAAWMRTWGAVENAIA
jgi:hypothetical protein